MPGNKNWSQAELDALAAAITRVMDYGGNIEFEIDAIHRCSELKHRSREAVRRKFFRTKSEIEHTKELRIQAGSK